MNSNFRSTRLPVLLMIILGLLMIYPVIAAGENGDADAIENIPYSRARILRIVSEEKSEIEYSGSNLNSHIQTVEALITKGPHEGETVRAEYELSYGMSDKYKLSRLKKGDEILLYLEENEDGNIENAYVAEVVRDRHLLLLVIGFIVLLALVGRGKGLKAILSLGLTVAAVLKILLPAILAGWDPVKISVGICVAVIGVTLLIVSGPNKKTLAAILGTTGGVVVSGIIALIIGSVAKLSGLGNEEAQMLMYIPQGIQFDFRGLLFAGIIIGTMGATMDVGMSIASAMHEVKAINPEIKVRALMKAGMNVGRDIMGTMSNTLILAYSGGALHLMLLFMAYQIPFSEIINKDLIASEILRAMAGSIGIIITIPITALAVGIIERKDWSARQDQGMDYRCM